MAVKRRTNTKNPPILSHEFIIQNHADIVACVAMVFVVGLMFQVTSPMASLFIALHHNTTLTPSDGAQPNLHEPVLYTSGIKDIPAIFFYLLIAIVMHQIVQEYLLDKVNRKLHLSKVKHTKFNESGQLVCFYLVSLVWAGDIMLKENMLGHIRGLWENYPHTTMPFMFKFFFIVQISYWLHVFPELYFQKIKREDMGARIEYASLYLGFIVSAYLFNYTRIALVLIVLQYVAEAVFHACRLLSYSDKQGVARPLYHVHEILFVLARLGTITVAVLAFWYGLAQAPAAQQVIDIASGTYNTFVFRLIALAAICLLQAYQMWNFITFHLKRRRENALMANSGFGGLAVAAKPRKTQQEKAKARKERAAKEAVTKDDDNDERDLPEVDQDTKKTLRQRK